MARDESHQGAIHQHDWGQSDQPRHWGNQGNAGNEGYYQGYEGSEETLGGHGSNAIRRVWDIEALRRRRLEAEQARRPKDQPRGYTPDEERIWEEITDKIMANPDLRDSQVDIEVQGQQVTLRGKAETKGAKRLIEDIAEDVKGVAQVRNELD